MKTSLFAFLLLSTTLLTTARAQTTDETAIRKTLDDLGTAADKRDLNTFALFFVQSPELYYQINTTDGNVMLARGIDNMKKMVGGYMNSEAAIKAAAAGSTKPTRIDLRITGNTAFANWSVSNADGVNQDFLVLQKTDGVWKISTLIGSYCGVGKLIAVN